MRKMIYLTAAAEQKMLELVNSQENKPYGIRVGVRRKGCSGLAYIVDLAMNKRDSDEVVDLGDLKLLIDVEAQMYIIGSEIDYIANELEERFVFNNPNSKGGCGCGKSFLT